MQVGENIWSNSKRNAKKVDFDYEDLKIVIGPATSNSYEINDDIKNKFEELTIDSTLYIETRGKINMVLI